jgi:septum formation protein
MIPKNYDVLLASNSPRRHQLLREMGIDFTVIAHRAEETYPDHLCREEIVHFLSEKKALSLKDTLGENQLLIASDTIVWQDGKALEKPADAEEARVMLRKLSGRKHTVYSGVTLMTKDRIHTFSVATEVYFYPVSEDEIMFYIENCQPFDKAGGYGMQEWIGTVKVSKIHGSYTNVVGLPTAELYHEIKRFFAH